MAELLEMSGSVLDGIRPRKQRGTALLRRIHRAQRTEEEEGGMITVAAGLVRGEGGEEEEEEGDGGGRQEQHVPRTPRVRSLGLSLGNPRWDESSPNPPPTPSLSSSSSSSPSFRPPPGVLRLLQQQRRQREQQQEPDSTINTLLDNANYESTNSSSSSSQRRTPIQTLFHEPLSPSERARRRLVEESFANIDIDEGGGGSSGDDPPDSPTLPYLEGDIRAFGKGMRAEKRPPPAPARHLLRASSLSFLERAEEDDEGRYVFRERDISTRRGAETLFSPREWVDGEESVRVGRGKRRLSWGTKTFKAPHFSDGRKKGRVLGVGELDGVYIPTSPPSSSPSPVSQVVRGGVTKLARKPRPRMDGAAAEEKKKRRRRRKVAGDVDKTYIPPAPASSVSGEEGVWKGGVTKVARMRKKGKKGGTVDGLFQASSSSRKTLEMAQGITGSSHVVNLPNNNNNNNNQPPKTHSTNQTLHTTNPRTQTPPPHTPPTSILQHTIPTPSPPKKPKKHPKNLPSPSPSPSQASPPPSSRAAKPTHQPTTPTPTPLTIPNIPHKIHPKTETTTKKNILSFLDAAVDNREADDDAGEKKGNDEHEDEDRYNDMLCQRQIWREEWEGVVRGRRGGEGRVDKEGGEDKGVLRGFGEDEEEEVEGNDEEVVVFLGPGERVRVVCSD